MHLMFAVFDQFFNIVTERILFAPVLIVSLWSTATTAIADHGI